MNYGVSSKPLRAVLAGLRSPTVRDQDGEETMKWFASGGGIAKAGPFPTERAAREAFTLTEDARRRQRQDKGSMAPYPIDLFIWPEDEDTE